MRASKRNPQSNKLRADSLFVCLLLIDVPFSPVSAASTSALPQSCPVCSTSLRIGGPVWCSSLINESFLHVLSRTVDRALQKPHFAAMPRVRSVVTLCKAQAELDKIAPVQAVQWPSQISFQSFPALSREQITFPKHPTLKHLQFAPFSHPFGINFGAMSSKYPLVARLKRNIILNAFRLLNIHVTHNASGSSMTSMDADLMLTNASLPLIHAIFWSLSCEIKRTPLAEQLPKNLFRPNHVPDDEEPLFPGLLKAAQALSVNDASDLSTLLPASTVSHVEFFTKPADKSWGPKPRAGTNLAQQAAHPNKKKPCRKLALQGACPKGEDCAFSHDPEILAHVKPYQPDQNQKSNGKRSRGAEASGQTPESRRVKLDQE